VVNNENHIQIISDLLKEIGLSDRSGSILYSGNETIKKGDYYFLGTNPGSHKDELEEQFGSTDTVLTQLMKENESFNEYFEGEWINKFTKKPDSPGQNQHQINIKNFFQDLSLDLKLILSTNLCFVRSIMEHLYEGNLSIDSKKCWNIHEYLLSIVKPRFIICNGSKSREFIRKKMDIIHAEPPKFHGKNISSTFHKGSLKLQGYDLTLEDIGLFSVPHLSYFTYYPESTVWIEKMMKNYFDDQNYSVTVE
jgi:hypothetical protein